MVKIFLLVLFTSILNANIYNSNCLSCHKNLPVSIDKYFYRYLLKYSSSKDVKSSMFKYLNNPNKSSTIMPEAFIKRFGVKEKTILNEIELKKAINLYWEEYKVFGKLK